MKFISESIIDAIALEIGDNESYYEKALEVFKEEQPILLGFLYSESFEAFNVKEREYLLFLALVIYHAIRKENPDIDIIDEDQISDAEESNWEKLETVTSKKFRERMDVFFKDYPQEDLLAFVEDALVEDEEEFDFLAKESREPLFVSLKSIIDCFVV